MGVHNSVGAILSLLNNLGVKHTQLGVPEKLQITFSALVTCLLAALIGSLITSPTASTVIMHDILKSDAELIAFFMAMLTWTFVKPFFIQAAQQNPLKQQLKKFKYNSELFFHALDS